MGSSSSALNAFFNSVSSANSDAGNNNNSDGNDFSSSIRVFFTSNGVTVATVPTTRFGLAAFDNNNVGTEKSYALPS
jgi:hypothetical protein